MKEKKLLSVLLTIFMHLLCAGVLAEPPSLIPLVGNYYKDPDLFQLQKALEAGADVNELNSAGSTPLIEAINRNRPDSIKFLLKNGADPNKHGPKKPSPLAYATTKHYAKIVRLLIDAGANLQEIRNNGDSILNTVDFNFKDDLDLIDLLVQNGARSELINPDNDPNKKDDKGDTLLYKAVKQQEHSAVAYLLRQGADPNMKTSKGITPLYAAVSVEYGNSIRLVKRLVAAGAKVNEAVSPGWTPLHKAATKPDTDVMSFLLVHGAEVDAQSIASTTPLMCVKENAGNAVLLLDAGASVKAVDKYGRTPLHFAAKNSDTNFAFFLVEAGADINARDASDTTPLFSAFEKRWYQSRVMGFVDFMLDKGADINAAGVNGKSLIEIAESHRNPALIKFLLDRGADCNIVATGSNELATQTLILKAQLAQRNGLAYCFAQTLEPVKSPLLINDDGETLLHLAVKECNSKLVQVLLEKGLDPNTQRKDGRSSLHLAVGTNHEEIIVTLVKAKADPNLADSRKLTPADKARNSRAIMAYEFMRHYKPENALEEPKISLLEAVKKDNHALAIAALENKHVLDEKDDDGCTPVFYAIRNRWHELSLRLINMGASVNLADKNGVTPLHLAVSVNDRLLAKELIRRGINLDAFNNEGETALFYAVRKKQIHLAELLVKSGANIKHVDKKGRNALFYSYKEDCELGTFAWLTQQGLQINRRDKYGKTVFHEMMNPLRRLSQVKKALKLGADWHIADKKGETPFSIALYGYSEELQNYVFELNSELVKAKDQMALVMHRWLIMRSYALIKKALASGVSTEVRNKRGKTLLIEAVSRDDLAAADILVEAGADLSPVAKVAPQLVTAAIKLNKKTRLEWLFNHHISLNLQTEEGQSIIWQAVNRLEIFDFLLSHGVKPPLTELYEEKQQKRLFILLGSNEGRKRLKQIAGPELKKLIFAGEKEVDRYRIVRDFISKGDLDGLKFAYGLGFDVNARSYKGRSLLHTAVLYKKLNVVKQLLEWGADIEAKNDSELTPLQYAISYNANGIAIYLIEYGASLECREKLNNAGLLHLMACYSSSKALLDELLMRGFTVNDRDSNGATPLLYAVEHGSYEMVDYLLQRGADPDIATEVASSPRRTRFLHEKDPHFYRTDYFIKNWVISGVTPLARAALRGKVPIINKLVNNGTKLDARDEFGNTPLHFAVMGNSIFAVDALLKAGAPVLVANQKEITPLELAENSNFFLIARDIWQKIPLHIMRDPTKSGDPKELRDDLHESVKQGKVHDLRWIVRRGTDVNKLDRQGKTPLMYAVEKGDSRIIHILLELGASPNTPGPEGETPWLKAFDRSYLFKAPKVLFAAGADVNSADKKGDTALHRAARNGDLKNIKFLIAQQAKLEVRNQAGMTPLMEAILRKDSQDSHEKVVAIKREFLERKKALLKKIPVFQRPRLPRIEENSIERRAIKLLIRKDPLYMNMTDIFGQTALHLAARKVAPNLIKELIEAGCNTEASDRYGRTPIFHAIAAGNSENVALLLTSGANALVVDKNLETTISLADSIGHTEIVMLLEEAGVSKAFAVPEWPETDENGTTRLMRAVAENRFTALEALLSAGKELNVKDKSGDTALFYAIRNCNYKMIKLLLEKGASTEVKNIYEQTPLQYARQQFIRADFHAPIKGPQGFFPEQKSKKDWQRIINLLEGKK